HQTGWVWLTGEHANESGPVFRDCRNARDGGVKIRLSHLHGVHDWQSRLLLECSGAPIPELHLVVKRVQHRRRIALADTVVDADRNLSSVGECESRLVTACARHSSVCRQPAIEEQLLAERDLFRRLWIVLRYHRVGESDRDTYLAKRLRSSQRIVRGNGAQRLRAHGKCCRSRRVLLLARWASALAACEGECRARQSEHEVDVCGCHGLSSTLCC